MHLSCRAGPACLAAKYVVPGGAMWASPPTKGQACLPHNGCRGRRPRRPVSAKRCHSEPVTVSLAWESVSPCLPLRGRWQREALPEGEMSCDTFSPPVGCADSPLPEGALYSAASPRRPTSRQQKKQARRLAFFAYQGAQDRLSSCPISAAMALSRQSGRQCTPGVFSTSGMALAGA